MAFEGWLVIFRFGAARIIRFIETRDHIAKALRKVLQGSERTTRNLYTPWVQVIDSKIDPIKRSRSW